jgi:hypothetical protein
VKWLDQRNSEGKLGRDLTEKITASYHLSAKSYPDVKLQNANFFLTNTPAPAAKFDVPSNEN